MEKGGSDEGGKRGEMEGEEYIEGGDGGGRKGKRWTGEGGSGGERASERRSSGGGAEWSVIIMKGTQSMTQC